MANIIDTTYFVNDILIPSDSGLTGVTTNLGHSIVRTQEYIMHQLLGDTLYQHYLDGTSTYSAFFTALVEGSTYDYDSTTKVIYKGLRGDATTKVDSCLAFFTYEHYLRAINSATTQSGNRIASSENSTRENSSVKIAQAQNKGLFLYGCYGNRYNVPSAYNFCRDGGYYSVISDIWDFTQLDSINQFGI